MTGCDRSASWPPLVRERARAFVGTGISASSDVPPRVDDVYALESSRRTSVADRVGLRRLAFAVRERPAEPVAGFAADHVHRVPEDRRVGLIRDVTQHADDFAALDLVERLAGKREVVALMVDRPRPAVADHHALVRRGDDVVERRILV